MGSAFPIKIAAKTILAGTALLLLGACASVPVAPEGEKQVGSAQILSICEKLAKSNDTRIAIGLCEKAHTEDPNNPLPLLILGDMLQQQGALAQAGRAYGMAIDLDPENVEAHYGLGKVFLARNQYELATEQFEVARELNARDHRLYNALGVVLDNLGDHVAAQEHYRVGLELAPNNRALKKNLKLSRRLDDSVTSPAIGPRFEVVPAPASTPGDVQSGGGATTTPRPTPNNRQAPPAPAGRLGHEPLAYAPVAPPQKNPYLPDTKAVAAQTTNRQFSVTDHHEAVAASQTAPDGEPLQAQTSRVMPQPAAGAIVTRSPAASNGPAENNASPSNTDNPYLAYFPIVAPAQDETADAMQASLPQPAAETQIATRPLVSSERPYIQPAFNSIHATAAPMQAEKRHTDTGPKILAAGLKDLVVLAEHLVDAPAAQPVQIAALPKDAAAIEKSPLSDKRSKSVTLPLVPTGVAEGFTAETSVSSLLVESDTTEPLEHRIELSLEANRFGVEKVAVMEVAPLPAADVYLPKVPQTRFGREHEGDHETRHIEGEFWDIVDVVNPMQHIPLVASIYRDVTEDEIKPAAKIAGGTLFGGVLGFASSIFDSVVEEASGQDMTQTAVTALSQDRYEAVGGSELPEREQSVAWHRQRQQIGR